ncbi:LysR family transcriptional regulator [Xanthobacter dioxanivorans]|uniref:LysR family transcriptional regulator n=1 Tax=Xanthobacter dioxanivorans TaxID=2528964 RepID=A0A974PNI2_9HYPH|nr:LysR substrate-binding domain-containing protein [Xanthobacter dioxanivorans]QRG06245.1 LysR family transcriptional regulator [Xanthobacter dioxanivorans]
MDTEWLRDLICLAEAGNFHRAAELRNVTQPAFSRRIRAFEEWAGAELVDRSGYRISLTEAGQHILPIARDVLRLLQQGREDARAIGRGQFDTLRFASTHALSFTFFPDWLRSLEPAASSIPIILQSDTMAACEHAMLDGSVQFLLAHYHAAARNRLSGPQFLSKRVGADVLLPVSAPNTDGTPRHELDAVSGGNVPYLSYSAASGLGRILEAVLTEDARPEGLAPVFKAHLAEVLRTVARAGRGIAWIPQTLVHEDLKSGQLVLAHPTQWSIALEIRLFRPRSRQSEGAEEFWSRLIATDVAT